MTPYASLQPSTAVRVQRFKRLSRYLFVVFSVAVLTAGTAAKAQIFDINSFKGKVVYLDFWASWCGPCRVSFPWMDRVLAQYGSEGLAVVAVNMDHDRDLALTFLQQHRQKFSILYDTDGGVASSFHIKAMPSAVIIGRDGQIRAAHSGFFEDQENQYLAEIRTALNEKAP